MLEQLNETETVEKRCKGGCHRKLGYDHMVAKINELLECSGNNGQISEEILKENVILNSINKIFQGTLEYETEEEIARTCLSLAEDITNSKFGFIGKLNENGLIDIIAVSTSGERLCNNNELKVGAIPKNIELKGFLSDVIKEERAIIINDMQSDLNGVGFPEGHPEIKSFIGVPLKHAGRTIGLIALANKEKDYNESDKTAVESMSVAFVVSLTRNNSEAALKDSEEMFRAITSSAQDAIIMMDNSGNVSYWNDAAKKIFGYEAEEILGKPLHDYLVPEKYRQAFEWGFARFRFNGKGPAIGKTIELTALRKDGCEFPVELSLSSTKLKDKWNSVAVVRDITTRKNIEDKLEEMNEKLNESNKNLQQFAYIASHDLQEPIRMVSSYLTLLSEEYRDKLDEEANEYIDFAVEGANRMRAMVNDLLSYSRVQTRGKKPKPVDAQKVYNRTVDILGILIDEYDAVVTCDPLPEVMADENQLMQVFQNLIKNAIQHSVKVPRIHVSVEDKGDKYLFIVEDNGEGIPPEQQSKIFDIFYRGNSNKKDSTGIGLAICKRIVNRHGGDIWVESELGKGARFHFTLNKVGGIEE